MRKVDELSQPTSCLNKAKDNEMLFVLLGRDRAAADTVRFWCQMRVKYKKNAPDDPQIREALACANTMEEERLYVG
jgi:hypothetical protein